MIDTGLHNNYSILFSMNLVFNLIILHSCSKNSLSISVQSMQFTLHFYKYVFENKLYCV